MVIDWPMEWFADAATQAVEGSWSNADAGPSDGSLISVFDPYEDADTDAAPIGDATVSEFLPEVTA